jgi:hypothetical protein
MPWGTSSPCPHNHGRRPAAALVRALSAAAPVDSSIGGVRLPEQGLRRRPHNAVGGRSYDSDVMGYVYVIGPKKRCLHGFHNCIDT